MSERKIIIDQDTWVVALLTIENCDLLNSIGPILQLYKNSNCSRDCIKRNAPTLNELLKSHNIPTIIGMSEIYMILVKCNASPWHFQFILQRYVESLNETFKDQEYKRIKNIKVIVNEQI